MRYHSPIDGLLLSHHTTFDARSILPAQVSIGSASHWLAYLQAANVFNVRVVVQVRVRGLQCTWVTAGGMHTLQAR